MVQARLMRAAFLAGLLATTSFTSVGPSDETFPDEAEPWQRFSQRCAGDSLRTLPAEASPDEDFWTIDVSGLYTVTSTGVLMPETEGALRVIEFSRLGERDSEP